jgi:DNA-binding GntR family transcriptional regulator
MIGNVSTYSNAIYEQLREEILSGAMKPGDRLVELELARRMGTSQGPVREALARLRAEELTITLPHRGSFVSEISVEDARDTYDVRRVLEPYAHKLALPRMGEAEYRVLEEEIDRMAEAAKTGRFADNVAHDMAFHRQIFHWSGSPMLMRFWHMIEAKTRNFIAVASPAVFDDPEPQVRSHYALLELMRKGDLPALEKQLDRHLAAIWIELGDDGDGPAEGDGQAASP